ncbi:MAG TPA: hypothetical protein VGT08_15700 [Terracidiphilus sp.]|nr:hypothetical protein [Terracidiphilus sp.]
MAKNQAQDPRRLLVLFLIATLAPAACLAWLGWRMVEQDRILEGQRIEERRNQAADLAAASFQRILAEAEETLTTFSSTRLSPGSGLGYGAALVALGRTGVLERAGTFLPYYPGTAPLAPPLPAQLAEADELELRKNDLPGALRAIGGLANSGNPVQRGEAILRLVRIERKQGNISQALEALKRLGDLSDTPVGGLPAALEARQGRALIFESIGRHTELQCELASGTEHEILRMNDDTGYMNYAAVSSDGHSIAGPWTDPAGKESRLEVLSLAGGAPRILFHSPGSNSIHSVTWTRDGRSIVFQKVLSATNGGWEWWIIPVNEGAPRKLAFTSSLINDLHIHPDGRHVIFIDGADKAEIWAFENLQPTLSAKK